MEIFWQGVSDGKRRIHDSSTDEGEPLAKRIALDVSARDEDKASCRIELDAPPASVILEVPEILFPGRDVSDIQ